MVSERGDFVATSVPARTPGTGGLPVLAQGSGRARRRSAAEVRAVAESVERYCAGFWDRSTATTLTGQGEDATVVGHLLEQCAEAGVLLTSTAVAVPAHRVLLPYPHSPAAQDSTPARYVAIDLSTRDAAVVGWAVCRVVALDSHELNTVR